MASSDPSPVPLPDLVVLGDPGRVAFGATSEALAFALAARAQPGARGQALDREGPGLAGLATLALPGQVLTSAATWRGLRAPTSVAWAYDHGVWLLAGAGLIGVLEVLPAGQAPGACPPSTSRARRLGASRNLPVARTSFHGRAAEVEAVIAHLRDGAGLVSVVGSGGMGKSRLATEVAGRIADDYPGGVFLVELADVWGRDAVSMAVTQAIEAPSGAEDPLSDVLPARGRMLLVIHNAETGPAEVSAFAARWREEAPQMQILVTSRAALGAPGEVVVGLDPLPLEEGVALFVARARMANASFSPQGADLEELRQLVVDLDAMPLAIELAAARMRVFTPRTLRERLEPRFQMLRGPRGAPWRQGTLGATLDWSWVLLQPWEQAALAQLSVFATHFSAQAAEAVVDLRGWPDAPSTAQVMRALVDHSVARRLPDGRFALLRTIASYAMERLAQEGAVRSVDRASATGPEAVVAARHRYVAYFAWLGATVEEAEALLADRDDLVAAARLALALGDVASAVPIAIAAGRALARGGSSAVGAALIADVLEAHTARDADHTRLLLARARLLRPEG